MFSKREYNISTVVFRSALSASAGMSSGPAALSFFSSLMALVISSLVGFSRFMSRSLSARLIFRGFCGAGLFNSSSKCSAHLFSSPSMPWIVLPFLSLTGRSGQLCLPDSFLLMLYSVFKPFLAAALSPSSVRLSMNLRLSALALFFTFLLASI